VSRYPCKRWLTLTDGLTGRQLSPEKLEWWWSPLNTLTVSNLSLSSGSNFLFLFWLVFLVLHFLFNLFSGVVFTWHHIDATFFSKNIDNITLDPCKILTAILDEIMTNDTCATQMKF